MVTVTGSGSIFTAGENYTLTCQTSYGENTTNVTSSYLWLKNDRNLSNQTSSILFFSPLKESDSGRYSCQVTRDNSTTISKDSVVVTVNGESQHIFNYLMVRCSHCLIAPFFSVTISSSGQPTEGQDYVLTCNVSGIQSLSASITYQWDKIGSSFGNSTSQQLTFNQLMCSDGGQYRCTVTISSQYLNSTNNATNSTTIIVTCKSLII